MIVKDDVLRSTGLILKSLRVNAGYTQESLALDCDLDRTFISMLERGIRQPSIMTLFTLATALNVQPSTILLAIEEDLLKHSEG